MWRDGSRFGLSRYGLHTCTVTVFRDSFTEDFNRFVTSTVAYLDAARIGKCRVHAGSWVRRQSYIRPTDAELSSAWP